MTQRNPDEPPAKNGLLVKVAVGCAFVVVMIIWQQYYFHAIDDVDGSGTTLWNWPAFLLIAFGIGALAFRLLRLAARRRNK